MRIVVAGLMATWPLGGVFWDYAQYLLGFRDLGHEVLYVEDTGGWCYDPGTRTRCEGGARNARRLGAWMERVDLGGDWHFRDAAGQVHGRPWEETAAFCRDADLFLNVSCASLPREEYLAARRTALVDSDPLYTQQAVPAYLRGEAAAEDRARLEVMARYDVHLTFGESVGRPGCRVPDGLFRWVPTRQPVVLDLWEALALPAADRRPVFTTVGSWEPGGAGPEVDGTRYAGKSAEFLRFLDLPARSPLPLEAALAGEVPRERLAAAGWHLADPDAVAADPWAYARYLARSTGEWSVAKNAYVASRSGWFSCRTACYLALGVPAVVQGTGFEDHLPTGEGLLAFDDLPGAAAALESVASGGERHGRAAREVAREHLDARRVLGRLLEACS